VVDSDGSSEVENVTVTVVVPEGARLDVTVLELPLVSGQSLQPGWGVDVVLVGTGSLVVTLIVSVTVVVPSDTVLTS
jgi:hypothetical protein